MIKHKPDPDEKKMNITNFLMNVISRLNIPPRNMDEAMEIVNNPEIMHVVDDPMACEGRTCETCESCDSLQSNISEIREVGEKEESDKESDDIQLNVAENALDIAFHSLGQVTNFSSWELTKFAHYAIREIVGVDIFKMRLQLLASDRVTVNKIKWCAVKTFMIINGLNEYIDNFCHSSIDDNTYQLFMFDNPNTYYPPTKIMSGGKGMAEFVNAMDKNISRPVKLLQGSYQQQASDQARWTGEFNKP